MNDRALARREQRPADRLDRLAFEPADWGALGEVAEAIARSGMGPKTPQACIAVMLLGRELKLTVMQSIRGIHVIEGKPALSAQMMVALILQSGAALYFRRLASDETSATWETHRKGDPSPIRGTFTRADAERAGLWQRSTWKQYPRAMLRWRAAADLAREVFPDVVGGLYTAEELGAPPEMVEVELRAQEPEQAAPAQPEMVEAEIVEAPQPEGEPAAAVEQSKAAAPVDEALAAIVAQLKAELVAIAGDRAKAIWSKEIAKGPKDGVEMRARAVIDRERVGKKLAEGFADAPAEPAAATQSAAPPACGTCSGKKTVRCRCKEPDGGRYYDGARCPECDGRGTQACHACTGQAPLLSTPSVSRPRQPGDDDDR